MACNLFTSGRLPPLGDHLLAVIRQRLDHETIDLFNPLTIFVSHRLAGEWLKLHLSTGLEGRADIRFETVEQGLRKLLSDGTENAGRPLGNEDIRDLILSVLLLPESDEIPLLEPVWSYLFGASRPPTALALDIADDSDSPDRIAWWRRAWTLATAIADLFVRYEDSTPRPESSPGGFPVTGNGVHADWQSALYTAIFREGGRRDKAFPKRRTLRQTADAHLGHVGENREKNPEFFVFATPPAVLQTDILATLARHRDLQVYCLAPGEARDHFEPPHLWNKPVREALERFRAHAATLPEQFRFEPLSEPPRPATTFLHAAQAFLSTSREEDPSLEKPRAKSPGTTPDTSLQIIACPGVHREVETVVQLIAGRGSRSPVSFNDIGVFYTDPGIYLQPLRAAFQAAGIPAAFGGATAITGPFAAGVESLWNIASEGMSRQAVFRLFANPCWQEASGADSGMVRTWLGWVEALGIRFGFSVADKCRECELPGERSCAICSSQQALEKGIQPTSAHTWQLALRRLRLGRIMEAETYNPTSSSMPEFGGCAPFRDFESSDDAVLESFCTAIETLSRATGALRKPGLGADGAEQAMAIAWADAAREAIDLCLRVRVDHPEDAEERNAALGRLSRLRNMGGLLPASIPFSLAREYALSDLSAVGELGLKPLFRGVAVLPLSEGCRAPFRDIYVVGLGENQFPGGGEHVSIDLLPSTTLGTDEHQRQAFLQAVLSVRERLVLTYCDLDPKQEALLNPSSVLVQACDLFQRHLIPDHAGFPIHRLPGSPLSARYLQPSGWAKEADPLAHLHEAEWLAAMMVARQAGKLSPEAAEDVAIRVRETLSVLRPPEPSSEAEKNPLGTVASSEVQVRKDHPRLWIKALVDFLRDPASALANRWIRTGYDAGEDAAEVSGTPLISDFLVLQSFMTRALRSFFLEGPALDDPHPLPAQAFFERFYAWEKLQSKTPDGIWSAIEKHTLEKPFLDAVQFCQRFFLDNNVKLLETISIGRPGSGTSVRMIPPVSIPHSLKHIPESQTELLGRMPLVWRDAEAFHTVVFRMRFDRPPVTPEKIQHFMLEPFLSFAALLMHDGTARRRGAPAEELIVDGRPLQLHVCSPDGMVTFTLALSESEAESYLTNLVQDYFDQSTFEDVRLKIVMEGGYPKPSPAAGEAAVSEAGDPAVEYLDLMEDALERALGRPFPPTFDSDLFAAIPEPAIPPDVLEKVRRRFVPIIPQRMATTGGEKR